MAVLLAAIMAGVISMGCVGADFLRKYFRKLNVRSVNTQSPFGVVNIGATIQFYVLAALYLSITWLVMQVDKTQLSVLLGAVVVAAIFQSTYGIVSTMLSMNSTLGIWDLGMHPGSAMGTFYSRNQFAGFLALALPIGSAWLWRKYRHSPSGGLQGGLYGIGLYCYVIAVVLALLLSHSRWGLASAVVGLLVWYCLSRFRNQSPVGFAEKLVPWLFLFAVMLLLLWLGPELLIGRYLELSLKDNRFQIWNTLFGMPLKLWIWGIGPGQFVDVFKMYQPTTLPETYWRGPK